jgi:hypothetical protein
LGHRCGGSDDDQGDQRDANDHRPAARRAVEDSVPSDSKWRRRWFPLLVEFRIPAKDANWLLWQLSLLNITAAFVYPSLRGVVEALREQRHYHYELLDRGGD